MTAKLFVQAIVKFLLGVVLVGVLVFLPAGSFAYPNGWLLMGVLFVPMFIAGIVMMIKNPALLGSLISLAVFAAYPFIIAGRIRHEEKLLERELPGYREYKQKVKYRLIPYIW